MDKVGRGFPPGSRYKGDDDAFENPTSSFVRASAVHQPLVFKSPPLYKICIVVIFASTYFSVISAQDAASFSVPGTSYKCSPAGNMICLQEAHTSEGEDNLQSGMLSLISGYSSQVGVAYYNEPIKFQDLSTNQAASFNTSFTVDIRNVDRWGGDGMAFLISANNSYTGGPGGDLGIFDLSFASSDFKSIIVELDIHNNNYFPINDISDNHVSFDLMNITAVVAANASDVGVRLSDNRTTYVWVEYSDDTKQFEVRVSYTSSRPVRPLLNHTVNLFDFVEEYMWVGFTASSGANVSNFYVGDWSFESYGLWAPSPEPSSAPNTGESGANDVRMIVGMSLGIPAFLLAWLFIALTVSGACIKEDPMMQLEAMPKRYSYKELSVATRNFSEESKLGQGAFGSVYRGVLPSSGIPVAVKKIECDSNQGQKDFMAEVSIISGLRQRNLVQLKGWCMDISKGKYLLVYELMPNGSLDKVLFEPTESQKVCLSWPQRFNIVTGIAVALDYLHNGWNKQVIHRDIKSSNILLDNEWNAKLGDFGLARVVNHEREAATTQPAGTLGYYAPEVNPYGKFTGKFTDKTDVFAFGVVVLEVACGRKALLWNVSEDERFLVDWVRHRFGTGELMSIVDERLQEYDISKMEMMLNVGLLCSHQNPSARPSMRDVVQILAGKAPVPSIPPIRNFEANPVPGPEFRPDPPDPTPDASDNPV